MKYLFMLLLLINGTCFAKVISKASNGFSIKIETKVPVNNEVAYQQFLKVGKWWHPDHTWFGKSESLTIIPEVGQCFCEKNGDKQALHMTISYVDPNKEIRMIGGLGPLQMLGIHGGMSWKFEPVTDSTTKIIFTYQVSGYMDNGLDSLAPIVDKVQGIQLARLKAILSK
ncbi:SRPBCC domain-containing protein [Litorilituus lipolyticus]|uniref:SRPBCC domain-containing protein n=1 Tax=Litorilituus lipolyticus TaxID=2491017 RepID=A0A502L328_9GAMM|nr:SRPBCC domain-containing protein [Litorilituus lipolyticus]TPH18146.1 SRPBCC domain-containing protein [Litorilituus lipolyticus]